METVMETVTETVMESVMEIADFRNTLPANLPLCPVAPAARIIGQKWTLQIVYFLLDGKSVRFCELQDALGGVNPSTLSSRLKMLETADISTIGRKKPKPIPVVVMPASFN